MKQAARPLRLNRKKILVILIILAVISLAAYGGLSAWTWSQYKNSYVGWKSDVKSKLDLAMGMPVTTTDQKAKWLDALNTTATTAAEPTKCGPGAAYGWQQAVIPVLKKEVTDCQQVQDTIDRLHDSLMAAIKSIRTDEVIAAILGEPLKTTTVNEAAYQGEIDTWSKAAGALRSVDAPNEVAGVKTAAISAAEGIKTAWNALLVANTAQNASQYQMALNALSEAYKGLNNVSNESKKALQSVGHTVQKAHDDAF